MRRTLDLGDGLSGSLMARYPCVPRAEAMARAIREYRERESASLLLVLAGDVDIVDVSGEVRAADRTS